MKSYIDGNLNLYFLGAFVIPTRSSDRTPKHSIQGLCTRFSLVKLGQSIRFKRLNKT